MDARAAAMLVALLLCAALPAARASNVALCVRNCAQCKRMFGEYFEGELCADTCIKYKGKVIPDCEDIGSIAPFLNRVE
ncbi:eclosion hormone [Bacillus rossius redtenbacheri]|uniref:eclosion hormone n=1 Tax=Bacillus rossius redtenbacheri TaxID=93214 RepID=UPI002FDE9554